MMIAYVGYYKTELSVYQIGLFMDIVVLLFLNLRQKSPV